MDHRFRRLAIASLIFVSISLHAADEGKSLYIEGYAGDVSYAPGDELQLHLSSTSAVASISITRVGRDRTVVHEVAKLEGLLEHPVPENASSNGCNWPVVFRLPIPADWKSGYYEVKMKVADRGGAFTQRNARTAESSCYFVLRSAEPGKDSRILLQLATNTYNAYNNWGGHNFYGSDGIGGYPRVLTTRSPTAKRSVR
ncbi:MAG: N,N-dimethylformamidase beta subunit family domain-containing protein [Verrucomicrobiales bacterium]